MSKEIDEMILGFIKSKGIRKDWDYWVECWKNEKPYNPDKFTHHETTTIISAVNQYIKGATDIKTKQ